MKKTIIFILQAMVLVSLACEVTSLFSDSGLNPASQRQNLDSFLEKHPDQAPLWNGKWQEWEKNGGTSFLGAAVLSGKTARLASSAFLVLLFLLMRQYRRSDKFEASTAKFLRYGSLSLLVYALATLIQWSLTVKGFSQLPLFGTAAGALNELAAHLDATVGARIFASLAIGGVFLSAIQVSTAGIGSSLFVAGIFYLLAKMVEEKQKLNQQVDALSKDVELTI